jgi:diguanylate cyclase (GGDEF)-like protein/PAS domain S-box-containing protein
MDENGLLSALSLVSAFIYIFIGIYTYRQNIKSIVHKVFLILCTSYFIWSFAYSFAYISKSMYIFSFWNKIAAIGWCSFSGITLYLVLLITEKKILKNRIIKTLIFIPGLVFFYIAVFLFGVGIKTSTIVSNIFNFGDFLYNSSFLLISILILFIWGRRSNKIRIKKQSNILVLFSIIPFVLNLLTQTILPLVGDGKFPPMGQLYAVIMIFGTFLAITKYNFLRLPEKFILKEVANEIMDMVILLDEKGQIIRITKHTLDILKYEEKELLKQNIEIIIDKNTNENISAKNIKKINGKYNDICLVMKDGETIPVNITCKQIFDNKIHDLLGVIFIIQDISLIYELQKRNEELKAYVEQLSEAEEELRFQYEQNLESDKRLKISEEKFRTMFEQAPLGITLSDSLTGRFYETNSKFAEITGRTKEEIINTDWMTITHPDDVKENLIEMNLMNEKKKKGFNMNKRYIKPDGSIVWVNMTIMNLHLEDKINPSEICMIEDISEQKKLELQLIHLSYHDQLTGLYNRRFFEEELRRLDVQRNYPITIVMGDVNGLKLINDSLGHAKGDELLKKVAKVIKKGCRTDDIIARLGGDEFVILLPKTDTIETECIIKRIKSLALKEKVDSIDISISFGYETKNDDEQEAHEIFKRAEDYMYKKKLFESPSMRSKTISAIISALHEKNKREEAHSRRVSSLCRSIGKALNLLDVEVEELKTIGLLHDIGKIAIEENILNKPGKLTVGEWEEIKRHPEIGYRILSTVNDMSEMANYVLAHHERWDGTGYPKGLKGSQIPLQSRIISIADAFDAMTSERSYRRALSEEVAIEEMLKTSGTQFDPELVKVFIEKVLEKEEYFPIIMEA